MKIVGPYTSPTIYSEHPGIVELTSSDPSVASVDASVVIPGTRVYGNMGGGGDYLARLGTEGAGREDVTWLFEIDTSRIKNTSTTIAPNTDYEPLIGSFRQDLLNRANWFLFCWRNPNGMNVGMMDSLDSASPPFHFINGTSTLWTINEKRKYALTKASGGSVKLYTASRATATTATRNSVGSMGGSEVLAFNAGPLVHCSKILHICDNAELDAWFADGTIPATDREFVFAGGHEIDPAAPVIWDTSDNATPLDLTATQITNWQAPGMSVAYTDDPLNPVVPFQPFTITPNSTGTFTITARRRRQGVPDRASDGEKYETTSETFTITEMPAEVVQYVRLLITTSTPGTVDIASSDPSVVTFPSSVVVGPTLQYEVLGTVVGAGTSIITTSMGGAVLDTTTVTIEDTPTVIEAGPNQDVRTKLL